MDRAMKELFNTHEVLI